MEIKTTKAIETITEGRNWGRTTMYVGLMFGLALAFHIAFAPAAHAQELDPSSWATSAIDFLKKLWVFVILAEIVAALTYTTAFFTQSWFPSFFQAFQGEWVKKAVIIGVAAHPVMGFLFAAAEGAKSGFGG
jgi:hypothetical protein